MNALDTILQRLRSGGDAYAEEVRTRVLARTPLAFALTLGCATLSSIFEVTSYEGRGTAVAVFDFCVLAIIGLTWLAQRLRPAEALPSLVLAACAIGISLDFYHWAVRANPAMAVWTLTALFCSASAFLTWGWIHQAAACLGPLLFYPILTASLREPVDENLRVWAAGGAYLMVVCGLTTLGAHLIDGYLRERHDLALELSAGRARLRSYFELSTVGTAILTQERQWVEVNEALPEMLGYSRRELVGLDWSELVAPEDRELDLVQFSSLLRGDLGASTREGRLRRRDGSIVHVVLSVRALPAGAQETPQFLVIAQNIDGLRRDRDELRSARDAAERDNRLKGEFLASMSHEIRTPLNIIFGMTDMALDATADPEQLDALRRTRGATRSLLTLVDDVLDFSRMEAGKLDLRTTEFSVRSWLREVVDPLAVLARPAAVALELEVAPGVPDRVVGDPERLRQVVVNLVTNALKFTERGEVRVRVTHETATAPQQDGASPGDPDGAPRGSATRLHIVVEDTGAGIAPEEQQGIFEAFTQASSARSTHAAGTGLGLAICSRLVRLMNGRIWVESVVGVGSRFHFTAQVEPVVQQTAAN